MAVFKTDCGVWMTSEDGHESVARAIAVQAMISLGFDPNEFRLRDRVIVAISPVVEKVMDSACDDSIYCKAMKSMAAQFVHPKTTGEALAKMQLTNHVERSIEP